MCAVPMTQVVFRVLDAGAYAEIVNSKLPFSMIENAEVVIRSPLGSQEPLNDHLVWFWGQIQPARRVLKTAAANGARLVCECRVSNGPICLLPNGAEFLDLVGVELMIKTNGVA